MKALVTGIKSYLHRARHTWGDHEGRRYESFPKIRSKRQLLEATYFNSNTGNFLIGEGALYAVGNKLANFAEFSYLTKMKDSEEYLEEIRSRFSVIVFVTANLLRSDYDARAEAALFRALKMPVIVLGIGCQRTRDLQSSLPQGTQELIQYLGENDCHVFTRGKPTADFLLSRGVKNVWPTGCPSMFFRHENVLHSMKKLKEFRVDSSSQICFSGYIGTGLESVSDITSLVEKERKASYVLQDEYMWHGFELIGDENSTFYNDLTGEFIGEVSYSGASEVPKLDVRVFFNNDQWRGFMSAHDFCVGRRFHGVVSGLQAATPGLMMTIDDRMSEMASQFELPYIDPKEWKATENKRDVINRICDEFNYQKFEESFTSQYITFKKRMSDLGMGDN